MFFRLQFVEQRPHVADGFEECRFHLHFPCRTVGRCDCELVGDGRHWTATIVSPEFEGKRQIARHQRVYATLGEKMHTDEVHALSMKTLTPAEHQP